MENNFKAGDKVVIEGTIYCHDNQNITIEQKGIVGLFTASKYRAKHAEKPFKPREMLVWDKEEVFAKKREVIGIFNGKYLAISKENSDYLVLWNYAKEKELEKVSDEQLLKTFETWLRQLKNK